MGKHVLEKRLTGYLAKMESKATKHHKNLTGVGSCSTTVQEAVRCHGPITTNLLLMHFSLHEKIETLFVSNKRKAYF